MKKILLTITFAAVCFALSAQAPAGFPKEMPAGFPKNIPAGFFKPRTENIPVWPNGAPNAFTAPEGSQYTEATLEIYPAANPNGWCVIACPGGGYAVLSDSHEARDFKDWFNARGYTFCVLEYRLPRGHHDVPISDVQEAIKIMRSRKDLGIEHVGVMGCSAGGHLASTAATHFTSDENRPEFQILFYPVTTMDKAITHMGSFEGLLGDNPSQELIDLYSNDKQVTKDTPPALLILASDDFLVPVANSLRYYEALVANGVSASMHIYPSGGHGFGWTESIFKPEFSAEIERWLNTWVIKK